MNHESQIDPHRTRLEILVINVSSIFVRDANVEQSRFEILGKFLVYDQNLDKILNRNLDKNLDENLEQNAAYCNDRYALLMIVR